MKHEHFQCIAVVGLGLIGGSLVQSLRRALPERRLVGVDFPEVLERARAFLDAAHPPSELACALAQADLTFLATPVSAILDTLPAIARAAKRGAVITDVGSTKEQIAKRAQEYFAGECFFIGGHPMTGSESAGWENARPDLFQEAVYVLTPAPRFPAAPLEALQGLLTQLGAHVTLLDAEEHDRVAAEISHLPQLLAVALTNFIARESVASAPRLQMAAGGFRDMTRIAASPYHLWRDILRTNHANVRQALEEFLLALRQLEQELEREELGASFQRANDLHRRLLSRLPMKSQMPESMKSSAAIN
jgi:prephenate dehydrogenase